MYAAHLVLKTNLSNGARCAVRPAHRMRFLTLQKKSKMKCRKICQRTLDFVSLYCLDRGGGDTSIKDRNCES